MTATFIVLLGTIRALRPAISSYAEILKVNRCSESNREKRSLPTSLDPFWFASLIVAHIDEEVLDLPADGLLDRHIPKDRLGVVAPAILHLLLLHRRTKQLNVEF